KGRRSPSLGCRHGLLPEGLLCMERETTLGLFGRNVSGIFPDDRAEGGIRSTRGLTNGFRSPRGRRRNGDAKTRGMRAAAKCAEVNPSIRGLAPPAPQLTVRE